MLINSLKSKIIISVLGIVFVSLTITTFFVQQKTKQELSKAIEGNALNLLEATKNHVESQYSSILYHKKIMLNRRKAELKNITVIAFTIINRAYQNYKNGKLSEAGAKKHIINVFRKMRYDEGVGYFWINDMRRPYPKMIMHPTLPRLDGTILDDPIFNCALGKKENLFKAFVDVSLEKGAGYVDYLWPKPQKGGLTEQQPKISYVRLFKPWNWVVGTGVYIDDIEKDVQDRLEAVITDLNKTIIKQKIGESGYFYIFDEKNKLLVHPNLAGTDGSQLINPVTGRPLSEELKETAHSSRSFMEYLWDKPSHRGVYRFPKRAYIAYYKPLGWYICSTVYIEDLEKRIFTLTQNIILFSLLFLVTALLVSIFVSRSITNPLNRLIDLIRKTDKDGIPLEIKTGAATAEINVLEMTMRKMIDSISQSRKELEKQRDYSMSIIASSPYIICGLTAEGHIKFINPAAEELTGYKKEEIIGKDWWRLFYPGSEYQQVERLFADYPDVAVADFEMIITCKNGERKTIIWTSFCKRGEHSDDLEIIGFGNDITDRKKAELSLVESERNYREIFNASSDAIFIQDSDSGRIIDVNLSMLKMYDYEKKDVLGSDMEKFSSGIAPFNQNGEKKKIQKIQKEGPQIFEWQAKKSNGELFWVEISLKLAKIGDEQRVLAVVRDITERKKSQEMIIQNEKMLSVGGLAAGMAHEINNPLAGIIQTANVIANRLGEKINIPANLKAADEAGTSMESIKRFMEDRGILRMIDTIRESSSRVAKIVTNMLSFARKSNNQASITDLNELLEKTLELATTEYNIKKHYDFKMIKIVKEYEARLPSVLCEESKVQQVLINILRNGAQAMQDAEIKEPVFVIRTKFEKKGGMVCMEIEDNGPGMEEETRKRIFEPFFTTKPLGEGTGLGLSVSYFIITENHGGEMRVESQPGVGTKFIICLPLKGGRA